MAKLDCIRFSSLISDPEAYINELFQLHPGTNHNEESGTIEIKNPMIDSSFRYVILEKGLFLFSFESFSPVDAEYNFIPNPHSDYFTLGFYFTVERTKTPLYIKTADQFFSNDQISMFFNGNMTAEIFIKAKHKAYGLRLEIHKDWLLQHLDYASLKAGSLLKAIIDFQSKSYLQIHCDSYHSLVNTIISCIKETESATQKMQLKALSYTLIHQYIDEIIHYLPQKQNEKELSNTGGLQPALNLMGKTAQGNFPGNNRLAALCNISDSSFIKQFKTIFHTSPAHYFTTLKLKEALRLLQMGDTVKDTAHKVGYKDTSSFGRAFKQQFGKSPASYVK